MQFTIDKEKLSSLVQKVLNIVPSRATLPVLSNILIETSENKIFMKATDLDVSITSEAEANVDKDGEVTVPARMFAELIRELPAGEVYISSADNRVELKSEKGLYKIAGIPADEFPKFPEFNIEEEIKVPGDLICRMVRKTSFAVSRDETRPALNGILWKADKDSLNMVATNGHILSKMTRKGVSVPKLKDDIIVPTKALDYFVKLYGDSREEVGIIFGKDNLVLNIDGSILTTRLLDGPYPNYEQVIPSENDKRLIVERDDFVSLIRRVSILSNNITHQVKLGFSPSKITVSATNFDVGGEGHDEIQADYDGEELEIGYNANYLLEIVKQVDTPQAVVEFTGPTTAGVVKAVSYEDNEDYLYLVMPLRLTD
ncbi:MAG: DNA polymerase III subunit beta [candidate division Zixibacteria bacterium]|nr:DNA polymerase III subunit beta [candidate division Zixibacteria bacterium]